MKAHDVVTRMRSIEDNITGELGQDRPPVDECIAHLAGVELDGLDEALVAEAKRVIVLLEDWYAQYGVRPKAANVAAVGFLQGVTFCAAAQRMREEGAE